jgi:hypothetical protein
VGVQIGCNAGPELLNGTHNSGFGIVEERSFHAVQIADDVALEEGPIDGNGVVVVPQIPDQNANPNDRIDQAGAEFGGDGGTGFGGEFGSDRGGEFATDFAADFADRVAR